MTSFQLKLLACVLMVIDHIGVAFFENTTTGTILRIIGRLAFPIFAYQLSIGIVKTRNRKNYIQRLIMWAIISQYPYSLLFPAYKLNIMVSFIFSAFAIIIYEKVRNKGVIALNAGVFVLFGALAEALKVDFGMYGVLTVALFYFYQNRYATLVPVFTLMSILGTYFVWFPQAFAPLGLIFTYFRKEDPIGTRQSAFGKYFFYAFYPLHLAILGVLKLFVFKNSF